MQLALQLDAGVWPDEVPKGIKNPLYRGVGDRLRTIGEQNRLTQTAIGEAAKVDRSTISMIEHGKQRPRIDIVEKLATALGISPGELAFGDQAALRWRQRHAPPLLAAEPRPIYLASRPFQERYKGLGPRLRKAREARGWSLHELSRRTKRAKADDNEPAAWSADEVEHHGGISPEGILKLEAGERVPLVSTVEALAIRLDVSPGWLAYGEGEGIEEQGAPGRGKS